jgi:hypothetical protein
MYFFKHVRVKSALKLVKIGNNATNLTLVGIFLYIYFTTILQKYMVRLKFCKNIHLLP